MFPTLHGNLRGGLPAAFVLLVALVLIPVLWAGAEEEYVEKVYLTKREALAVAFPGIKKFRLKKFWISDAQKNAIEDLTGEKFNQRRVAFYEALDDKGQPVGYMTIGNEIGRSYPITFMVAINPDGTVKDVEIMVYREPHGWEVRFEPFMSQFYGRDATDPFANINNITGATLSVRSMTRGVKKAVAVFKVIFLDKIE